MTKSLLVLPLAVFSLYGQSVTGSIAGSVMDPGNLAVSSAAVVLTQTATGARRQAATNEVGRFIFTSLEPGAYDLSVEVPGFKRLEKRSIQLTSGETLAVGDLVLQVGAVSESIQVSAQGTAVQTASAERAGVITGTQVENLAIIDRNVTSLLQLLPGVVDTGAADSLTNNWSINVQGNRLNTINVSLNGATLNAAGNNNNSVVNVSMDSVAEVKVMLTNYQAEYGRMSGANVQIVSKSGARQFHGLASYFKRHEQFNANNFFNNQLGRPKPRYRFNTWNYNVGGPVYIPGKFNRDRTKLFFFWSQEYWPSITSSLSQLTVPSALERKGDFSQTLDVNNKLIAVNDPNNNKQAFPGNVVPLSRIDKNGQALLNFFPLPNFLDRTISRGNYNYTFENYSDHPVRTETLKLDYHIDSNNLLSGNYTHRRDATWSDVPAGSNWDRMRNLNLNDGRVIILQYRRIFSPTLISESSVGFSWRPWNHYPDAAALKANQRASVGYTLAQFHPEDNPLDLIPQATFGGVTSPANLNLQTRFPLTTEHNIFTISNSVTKVAGSHTVKAGIYADRVWAYNQNGVMFNGQFDFGKNTNNALDTNYAYSNAAMGLFNSYTEASARPYPWDLVSNIEWFVQENWKATRRLTFDYGMRFQLVSPSHIDSDKLSSFVPWRFNPSKQVKLIQPVMVGNTRSGIDPVTGKVYPAQMIGALAPGVGDPVNGVVSPATDKSYPSALIQNRGVQFAPRVGFSYDPFGKGRTAIRGGFGIFYNRVAQGDILYPYAEQPPMVQNPIIYYGTMPTLLSLSSFLFPSDILGLDPAGQVPMVMNFSLSVQQNVGFGTVVDVAYVGSLARHLLWERNLNAIPFGTNFKPSNNDPTTNKVLSPAFVRPYIGYNNINYLEAAGTSNYHSLQVQANRRFARRLQFGVSWTWSKAMDFVDTNTDAVSTLVPVRVWNYGLASFDRTHVLKANWLWDVPKVPWRDPVSKWVLNNWQCSGIASFISGQPTGVSFTTTAGTDITGSPTDGARVVMAGNPVLPKDERTIDRYFRTDVFRVPAVGTVGNAAKTVLRGPGINNWDLAVYKNFPAFEKARIQFRWELYNAFNHTQFSALNTTARFDPTGAQVNALFGTLTAARAARRMQFALRASF
jgi:hypothetical protein